MMAVRRSRLSCSFISQQPENFWNGNKNDLQKVHNIPEPSGKKLNCKCFYAVRYKYRPYLCHSYHNHLWKFGKLSVENKPFFIRMEQIPTILQLSWQPPELIQFEKISKTGIEYSAPVFFFLLKDTHI